ncbi:MAG: phosphoglycerate dehydrogenase [Acidobacteriota bacterium]|nr:phosphoglycerate dehydrogenase [Acidobacteriota bacterium]
MRPRVLVCDNVAASGVEFLRTRADVVEAGSLDEQALIAALEGCQALIVRSATKVTAPVLEACRGLKVVARAGVGVDNIDVDAATRCGVLVVNSPAGNVLAAAEHTLAMLLAAARNIPQADASMKQGRFDRKSFMGRQVLGKTLGIVGLGNIGAEVARRARALGMNVVAFDPYAAEEHIRKLGATSAPLDQLLAQSDFLTVHVPLTEETRGMIGARELDLLPNHAVVVNCARGGIIDEDALLQALQAGSVAGAALDVFVGEPQVNAGLVGHPHVIATPHLGASTSEAQETVVLDAAAQVLDVLAGLPPSSPVNVPALPAELMDQLSPYLLVARHLGTLANVLVTSAARSVKVDAGAGAPVQGMPLLAHTVVARMLSGKIDQRVNEVNAPVVARERGIEVLHGALAEDPGYSRYLEAGITGEGFLCELAGAVLEGDQPRILRIAGYAVDMRPEGTIILVWKDRPGTPGFIGAVGTTLGDAGVGIASIQVGHEIIDDRGLLVIRVLQDPSPEVLQAIREHPDVARLETVVFD